MTLMKPRSFIIAALVIAASTATSVSRAQDPAPVSGGHDLTGVIADSLRGRGLPGAQVVLSGTQFSVLTDSAGAFRFASVPAGDYRIEFFHPMLDSIAVSLPSQAFTVPLAADRTLLLAVPAARTLLPALCPGFTAETSALAGSVRDADTGKGVAGATIEVAYMEVQITSKKEILALPRTHKIIAEPSGAYLICGLPGELEATVTAWHGSETSAGVSVSAEQPNVISRGFRLGVSAAATGQKEATLAGSVRTVDGRPIPGASVSVDGAARPATTDSAGRFTVSSLPAGTRMVYTRRLGYRPTTVPVELTSFATQSLDIVMLNPISQLDTVFVRARRDRALDNVGFTRRARSSLGSYMTRAQIRQINAHRLTDILRRMPEYRYGTRRLAIPGQARPCPNLIIDGILWPLFYGSDIDNVILPDEIAAIEAYSASAPAEFSHRAGAQAACPTIVIWTRGRVPG